jgi:hypothetical protein
MTKQLIQHKIHWPAARPRLGRGARQRVAIGLLALTVALSAGLPAIAGDPQRDGRRGRGHARQAQSVSAEAKRSGKRIVKKSFSNGGAIAIPAAGQSGPAAPYPSTIRVGGFKREARIVDINLTLHNYSHGCMSDVDVLLVAPGGRKATVMSDVGSDAIWECEMSNITVTLDDEAANPLPVGIGHPLTSGSFQPLDFEPGIDNDNFPAPAPTPSGSDALSTFDGINPNGAWKLFVLDDTFDDVGSLAGGWKIGIMAKSKKKRR